MRCCGHGDLRSPPAKAIRLIHIGRENSLAAATNPEIPETRSNFENVRLARNAAAPVSRLYAGSYKLTRILRIVDVQLTLGSYH